MPPRTRTSSADRLELKVPPLLLAAVLAGGMGGLAWALPGAAFPLPMATGLGIAFGLLGIGIAAAGLLAFRRHRTTVDPLHPERAAQVVQTGIYARTRNPMYLGVSLVLLGWALNLHHGVALLGVPAFMAWLDRFQIRPEERILHDRFGADYEAYLRAVRRWF